MSIHFPITAETLRGLRQQTLARMKKDWVDHWVNSIRTEAVNSARQGYIYHKGPCVAPHSDSTVFPMTAPLPTQHIQDIIDALKVQFPDSRVYLDDSHILIDWCELCDAKESEDTCYNTSNETSETTP